MLSPLTLSRMLRPLRTFLWPWGMARLRKLMDSVAITTTAKEKTAPNFSPSPYLIGQQPFLTASPPHFTHFYRQIIPFYLFSIYLYQLSPSHYTSDVF